MDRAIEPNIDETGPKCPDCGSRAIRFDPQFRAQCEECGSELILAFTNTGRYTEVSIHESLGWPIFELENE